MMDEVPVTIIPWAEFMSTQQRRSETLADIGSLLGFDPESVLDLSLDHPGFGEDTEKE